MDPRSARASGSPALCARSKSSDGDVGHVASGCGFPGIHFGPQDPWEKPLGPGRGPKSVPPDGKNRSSDRAEGPVEGGDQLGQVLADLFAVRALPEAGQKQARKTARSMGLSVL